MKSYDVVGVGYACIDYLGTVPHIPESSTKLDLGCLTIQGGGPVATALVTLSRLGDRTLFLGKLGDDEFGQRILAGLDDENVACEILMSPGMSSPFAFVMITPDGERTILWTRGNLPFMTPAEVDADLVRSGRILLVDDIEIKAGIQAARVAREAGVAVVLDAGTPRAGIEELIKLTDHLVTSEKFPYRLTGERDFGNSLGALMKMGPKEVTATLGDRGCIHLGPDGLLEEPGFPVDARDTTGAGDVFHGAYVHALLQNWPARQRLSFANAVAALQTRKVGGRAAIPRLEEALDFMSSWAR